MIHPLGTQLRFARSEFVRCLDGVSEEDGVKRLLPMNCISWIVGHLANQENGYWFHTGEAHAIRQMLGHPDMPQFVGGFGAAV